MGERAWGGAPSVSPPTLPLVSSLVRRSPIRSRQSPLLVAVSMAPKASKHTFTPATGTAVTAEGTVWPWMLTPSGGINIGTSADRIKAKLLKDDTEADAQRRVEEKLVQKGEETILQTALSPALLLSRSLIAPCTQPTPRGASSRTLVGYALPGQGGADPADGAGQSANEGVLRARHDSHDLALARP